MRPKQMGLVMSSFKPARVRCAWLSSPFFLSSLRACNSKNRSMAEARRGRVGYEDTLTFTNSLCLAYTLCSGVLRAWIRRGTYGIDDAVIVAATCALLSQFAAVYVAIDHGAGQPWHYIETVHSLSVFSQVRIGSPTLRVASQTSVL